MIPGVFVFLLALGCASENSDSKPAPVEKAAEPAEKAAEPVKKTQPEIGKRPDDAPKGPLSASHVFIAHNDAQRKPPEVDRTKDEALKKISC